jgi:magnesium chelatase family protein
MLAQALTASLLGVNGVVVRVEVDVAFGLPGLTIVGLPGSAVQEARERVRSAIRNTGFEVPARRITVNLAPADLPKEGTAYDLAIAIGLLAASGQLNVAVRDVGLFAELALDGRLQPVAGTMALVAAARDAGLNAVLVAEAAGGEAAAVAGIAVHGARSLGDAVAHLAAVRTLPPVAPTLIPPVEPHRGPDLGDVRGQQMARRALEIAVAGRHSMALCGPPGVGKTLLAQCVPGVMPPLDDDEALEVSRIYSVAGLVDRQRPLRRARPFRAPHHTVSTQALVGGGPRVRPGEASLAHRGVLFLDETLEFRADALDALRQPLEARRVAIARVDGVLELPAAFGLLAAFNPCPCGWRNEDGRDCSCEEAAIRRYVRRLSGPLRDRIDVFVQMTADGGAAHRLGESSAAVAARIAAAWSRQRKRQGHANAEIGPGALTEEFGFSRKLLSLLAAYGRDFSLSGRRLHGMARIARTIADLAGCASVEPAHVREAARYRVEAWS